MKLPTDCPYAAMPSYEFIQPRGDCCRHLLPCRNEPLCQIGGVESEAYRFIWLSSFHGDATVQIVREGDAITLCWKHWSYNLQAASGIPSILTLSPADWERLRNGLDAAEFWSLGPDYEWSIGLDGANWHIEGCRKDAYHSLSRWSPMGSIHDLGRLFFDLSGTPLAEVALY